MARVRGHWLSFLDRFFYALSFKIGFMLISLKEKKLWTYIGLIYAAAADFAAAAAAVVIFR